MDTMTTALQNLIRRDGRSLGDIAQVAGTDKGTLSRFVRDKRTLTLGTADQICRGLGVDVRLVRVRKGG